MPDMHITVCGVHTVIEPLSAAGMRWTTKHLRHPTCAIIETKRLTFTLARINSAGLTTRRTS